MRVAVVQHDICWEDREATFAHLAPRVAAAAGAGAQLVLLSETFATGFSMRTEVTAEPEGGPSSQWLAAQAEAHGVWVGGSVPEVAAEGGDPYNTFVLAGPDGTQHRYRKIHRFGYGGEDRKFAAGSDHVTVTVEGVRLSLFVCYDLRFADEWWAVARDTDAYLCVANWPAARRRHWQALLVARAIENQAYVVACNRVGRGGKLDYAGDSMVIDPMGEVLASAAGDEALLVAEVDPARVAAARDEFGFLADRR
ncbi:MAG TPA: carbon-nitrogen family hydrolase [Acidimicrobiales bacterium]|nr:carbon-nitrogen family hydrolase [Acidimicrobiales bacterium]